MWKQLRLLPETDNDDLIMLKFLRATNLPTNNTTAHHTKLCHSPC